jgi:hypothetical protein
MWFKISQFWVLMVNSDISEEALSGYPAYVKVSSQLGGGAVGLGAKPTRIKGIEG